MSISRRGLVRASIVVTVGFVLSRLLGLLRNMVILSQYGAGRDYEAYVAAITIPDLVFQILAGGAVGSAFIPVFKGYSARGEMESAWRMTRSVMTIALVATLPVAVTLMVFAGPVAELMVPGWDAESKALMATMMRILLISPIMFAVSGFATSVLNSFELFGWAALAPIFYNLAIIGAALIAGQSGLGIEAVAVGATAGAALHLLVQMPPLLRRGFRPRPSIDTALAGVREVLRLMIPRMLGLGAVQCNQVVQVVLASFLRVGSLSFLSVAWQVMLSPLVLAMAVSTAVFPTLAADSALDRRTEVRSVFLGSLRSILFLTLPAAVGLCVLAEPLIRLLFQRGEFTPEATALTAQALQLYSFGLIGHAVVEIVDRVFYAWHDTWTPVRVAVCAIVANVTLSVFLMSTPLNFLGLALANSLAALGECAVLLSLLARRMGKVDGLSLGLRSLLDELLRLAVGAAAMGGVVVALRELLYSSSRPADLAEQVLALAVCVGAGVLTYLGLTRALRVASAETLSRRIFGR